MSRTFRDVDEAIERVQRLRDGLLANPFAENRAERLALVFASEARAWSQLFEQTKVRAVWRAALVAESVARRNAAIWRRRAGIEQHAIDRRVLAPLTVEV